ncbi:MAG: tetratricopeptide repeat protein [Bacteroidota bacterium]
MKYYILLWTFLLALIVSVGAQTAAEAELADRYYADGEYEAAFELYDKLYKKNQEENTARRIVSCYEALNEYGEALKFLDRVIRRDDRPIYPILKAGILEKTGQPKEAEKLYEDVISKSIKKEGEVIGIGSFLYQQGRLTWALKVYKKGRQITRNPYAFANEVANIHLQLGEFAQATEEYLKLYYANPQNYSAANLSILNMVGPPSQNEIEQALLRAVDKRPSDRGLRNMVFEFYVLAENFMEAFVQVKSIDRLFKQEGERVYNFAETMRNNKEYALSNKAYDYIINRHKNSPFFFQAHFQKAINNELKAFDQVPVDKASVEAAVDAYKELLNTFGRKPEYYDPVYRMSRLMVFYLFDLDNALEELENLTASRQGLPQDRWAEARLLIGDIQLMQQDFNKSKLTYTEVSDIYRDRQLGALAKYKLSELAYYKGEFNLAQALLGAIKDNTSNDISNDAIKLNLTIMDNTGLDSTTTALEMFANAQLLTYQRDYEASLSLLDSLAYKFPSHPLADEILWEKATIYLNQNEIERALSFIDRILDQFPTDIYGDDALYTKAQIYDLTLSDPDKAMELYISFLASYPGSLYSVEVRKRIRTLRQG